MPFRDVTPADAQNRLATDPATTYVDVRSTMEYAQGHAPNSVNVPLAEVDAMTGRMVPNPEFVPVMKKLFTTDRELIVGCASGGRSRQACMMLEAEGYRALSNLAGGFNGMRGPAGVQPGWSQLGLPVVTNGKTYAAAKAECK